MMLQFGALGGILTALASSLSRGYSRRRPTLAAHENDARPTPRKFQQNPPRKGLRTDKRGDKPGHKYVLQLRP